MGERYSTLPDDQGKFRVVDTVSDVTLWPPYNTRTDADRVAGQLNDREQDG